MGALSMILSLLDTAIPAIGSLVVMIRGTNGTTSAVVYLDQADAQFAANLKQVSDWLAAHPVKPAA